MTMNEAPTSKAESFKWKRFTKYFGTVLKVQQLEKNLYKEEQN